MTANTNRRPPIRCTPCYVRYEGVRYHIRADGAVFTTIPDTNIEDEELTKFYAKLIRREASRLRRNREVREQVYSDLRKLWE